MAATPYLQASCAACFVSELPSPREHVRTGNNCSEEMVASMDSYTRPDGEADDAWTPRPWTVRACAKLAERRASGEVIDESKPATRVQFEAVQRQWSMYYQEDNIWRTEKSGRRVFVPAALGQEITNWIPMTRGPGGNLWYDGGGMLAPHGPWRQGAEEIIEVACSTILGEQFTGAQLREVLTWCGTLPTGVTTEPLAENLVPVAGGLVLDLDTLAQRYPRDDERFTYQLPVAWKPNATCPAAEQFISEVVHDDAQQLVWDIFGLALLPAWKYRRAVMLLGGGSNGKSTVLDLLRAVLDIRNISSVTLHRLVEDRFAPAQLFGKLANIAGDIDGRALARTDVFKMLTGGDAITAEYKYAQPFQFVNAATPIFSANVWPVAHDASEAYFMRWIPIQFPRMYVEEDRELRDGELRADTNLLARITTQSELEGVLVKAVLAAKRIRERGGVAIPQSSRTAIAEHRAWADTVVAWVDDNVEWDQDRTPPRNIVYTSYTTWCKDNGRQPLSTKRFWPRLRAIAEDNEVRFYDDEISTTIHRRCVRGVRLDVG